MFEKEPVLSVSQVIELEKRIESDGTPLKVLMKRAGNSVAKDIINRYQQTVKVLIVCGSGNNGGDGWVVARDLIGAGFDVSLVTSKPVGEIKAEPVRSTATEVYDLLIGDSRFSYHEAPDETTFISLLDGCSTIVDAMLGTGFQGETLTGCYADWVQAINTYRADNHDCAVVSIDVPSGLSAQTGMAAEPCIFADKTITMLAYKPGLLMSSSAKYCGIVELAKIADVGDYLADV